MASSATAARAPPPRRAAAPRASPTPPPGSRAPPTPNSPPSGLARSASARASGTPRLNSSLATSARRAAPPLKSPMRAANGMHPDDFVPTDANDTLLLSLRRETEEKEELLVKVQNKDQQIAALSAENDGVSSALNGAESRLAELYADQERMEQEMASRIEVIEKLRTQVRELEKDRRETQKRYTEQAQTFEAERQSFYDNEQHLKSRIQTLTQARKAGNIPLSPDATKASHEEEEPEDVAPPADLEGNSAPSADQNAQLDGANDEANEPAEMTALRMELATLSISHSSLQNTSHLLQAELMDLKRVNQELQEENESYNMLLRERTLTGQFNPMQYAGSATPSATEDEEDTDTRSLRSGTGAKSTLERVMEEDELSPRLPKVSEHDQHLTAPRSQNRSRRGRANSSPPPHGESLGDLPITGPGLDLASELGRAENKDILEGRAPAFDDKSRDRRREPTEGGSNDVDTLRNEVRALKDANKALSLYASKILDRILGAEGFEHVLAVDFDKSPNSPRKANTSPSTPQKPPAKGRPQSFFGALTRSTVPETEKPPATPIATVPTVAPAAPVDSKRQRRSMSFDWRSFSLFSGDKTTSPAEATNPSLRPLTLRPGTTSIVGARKLETTEDDEDRRERERLNATMKLMGIDAPQSPATPVQRTAAGNSILGQPSDMTPASPEPANSRSTTSITSRFSFFRSKSTASSTEHSTSGRASPTSLTTEALEQREAEQTLATLDAREKQISIELAQGKGSGFTEMSPRISLGDEWRSRRSRRSASGASGGGSAGTVWSAGMGKGDDDDSSLRRVSEDHVDEEQ